MGAAPVPARSLETGAHEERGLFYVALAFIALAAAAAGLSAAFVALENPDARISLFVYGGLALSWCAAVLWLARARRVRRRGDVAFLAMALAVVIAYALPQIGLHHVDEALAAGSGEAAYSLLLSLVAATFLFLALAFAAVYSQKRPDAYARFMVLATAALLWPLWMRLRLELFPDAGCALRFVPLLADLVLVAAMIRDSVALKAVHPVYSRMGGAIVIAHLIEAALYDTTHWLIAAKTLYGVFAG